MAAYDQMRRNSLYVGDLHPQVTENDLIVTFARAGPLLSVRLCRDKFSGKSLRYGYVNFWLPCHADTALECLNHTLLRGKPMRIMRYEKNSIARNYGIGNLFVKNLDQSITSAILQSTFSEFGRVLSCKVVEENGISRGFGYVQFDSEGSATAAIKALNGSELEGKKLYVAKFRSRNERRGVGRVLRKDEYSNAGYLFPSIDSHLCVMNLAPSVDDKKLAKLFSGYGRLLSAKVYGVGGVSGAFGFVCFSCPYEAKMASISLNGTEFEGRTLYVEVAKVYNPYGNFSMLPRSNWQLCYPGSFSPVSWSSSCNSPNPFQAQNFCNVSGLSIQTLKISNGNGREFRKDCGAVKTFYVTPSHQIYNKKPGFKHQPLIQTLQDEKPSSKLQEKLDNGEGKELHDSSDTTKTHCIESSPDTSKKLQPENTDITEIAVQL